MPGVSNTIALVEVAAHWICKLLPCTPPQAEPFGRVLPPARNDPAAMQPCWAVSCASPKL